MTVTHHSMIIGGEEVDTSEQLEIVDPSTGEVVATVARGDESHIDLAVESGRKAFDAGDWSRAAPAERAAVLRNLANLLGDNIEEMVEAEIQANGATVRQATGFHVGLAAPHLEYFALLRVGDADEDRGLPDHRPVDGTTRADRCRGCRRALELPAPAGVVEDGAGAGRGQQRGDQAR